MAYAPNHCSECIDAVESRKDEGLNNFEGLAKESNLSSQQVEVPPASVEENIQEGLSAASDNPVKVPVKPSEQYQNAPDNIDDLFCELEESMLCALEKSILRVKLVSDFAKSQHVTTNKSRVSDGRFTRMQVIFSLISAMAKKILFQY